LLLIFHNFKDDCIEVLVGAISFTMSKGVFANKLHNAALTGLGNQIFTITAFNTPNVFLTYMVGSYYPSPDRHANMAP
jgi:hypothetical protein